VDELELAAVGVPGQGQNLSQYAEQFVGSFAGYPSLPPVLDAHDRR